MCTRVLLLSLVLLRRRVAHGTDNAAAHLDRRQQLTPAAPHLAFLKLPRTSETATESSAFSSYSHQSSPSRFMSCHACDGPSTVHPPPASKRSGSQPRHSNTANAGAVPSTSADRPPQGLDSTSHEKMDEHSCGRWGVGGHEKEKKKAVRTMTLLSLHISRLRLPPRTGPPCVAKQGGTHLTLLHESSRAASPGHVVHVRGGEHARFLCHRRAARALHRDAKRERIRR